MGCIGSPSASDGEAAEYMIPSYWVQMERLPLTRNGKVDRRALPEPRKQAVTTNYEAPRTEMEERLVQIWQEVLGVDSISIHDHFFEKGGDSIKAMQMAARLYQCDYKLEMKDLFQYPTIAELSPRDKIDPCNQQTRIGYRGSCINADSTLVF